MCCIYIERVETMAVYHFNYISSEKRSKKIMKLFKERKFKELIIVGFYFFRMKLIREVLLYSVFKMFNKEKSFMFEEEKYLYCIQPNTFFNERMLEVPIFKKIIFKNKNKRVLEVGNVLSHYMSVKHDVLDKYEVFGTVINSDVVDFTSKKKYDLIISISTLEHVGWDELPHEPLKVLRAIENLKKLLKVNGLIIFSVPWNQNPTLDRLIHQKKLGMSKAFFFRRLNGNLWSETSFKCLKESKYEFLIPRANGVVIGIIEKKGGTKSKN